MLGPQFSEALAPPTAIPDHELLGPIASGAYGEVWLARNAVGTPRAVKIVRRDRHTSAESFDRELKGLQKFEPVSRTHDGLVDILTLGLLPDGAGFYYVMELADAFVVPASASLSPSQPEADRLKAGLQTYTPRTLRADLKSRGALPADEVIALGLKLTAALAHLHAHGLVHRDVKPSNILFIGGEPKLADAGLVAAVDDARSLVGTAGYIAPEGPGTPQADLYALGKVLYEAAFGKDRQEFPALPADIASRPDHARLLELNAILLQASATDRRERYQSADQMRADLELLRAGRSARRRQAWQKTGRLAVQLGAAVAVVVAAWLLFSRYSDSTVQRLGGSLPTIAVLPFDDESPGASHDNFGELLAEEISANLTRVPGLRVMGRSTAATIKKSPERRSIALQSKVSALLEGRIRRQGNQSQIAFELVDTLDGVQLWSGFLPVNTNDLFALQIELNQRVPKALRLRLTDTQKANLMVEPTKNLEAQRAYWEGFHFLNNAKSLADVETASAMLRKATQLDSKFAIAFALLSSAYQAPPEHADQPTEPNLTLAREAASRALTLDPNLPEGHLFLAMIKESYDFDWAGAELEYRRAVGLSPNLADARARYALFLLLRGRGNEAKDHYRIAAELDPFAAWITANLGHEKNHQGKPDEAIQQFRRALELGHDPDAHRWIAETCAGLGRDAEAVKAYENYWLARGEPQTVVDELRAAHAADGWRGYWRKRLDQIEKGSARYTLWWAKAQMHARLGDTNAVLECLEKSYRNREYFVAQMKSNEEFRPFRSDPRFDELLRKMNLSP